MMAFCQYSIIKISNFFLQFTPNDDQFHNFLKSEERRGGITAREMSLFISDKNKISLKTLINFLEIIIQLKLKKYLIMVKESLQII